jgi:tetratricopeptide (TPR) repeat protein
VIEPGALGKRSLPVWMAVAASAAALVWDPAAPAAEPKRALLLAVGLCALAVALTHGRALRVPRAVLAWLGLAGWSALSLLWGSGAGVGDVAGFAAAGLLMVAACSLDDNERGDALRYAALLAGTGAAAWAIVQAAVGARGVLLHGGQGNANWLGLLLAITLPLSIEGCVRQPSYCPLADARGSVYPRVLAVACVAMQAAGLWLSQSRVAWAASGVAAVVWVALRPSARRAAGAFAAAGLALGAALLTRADVSSAWAGRAWIWQSSADVAADSMPWGTGMGLFAHRYLDIQGARLAGLDVGAANVRFENAVTAHNDWLQVAAESGLIAFLLLAGCFWLATEGACRARDSARAAALAALAVCAAGDSPLRQPAVLAMVALLLAAAPDARSVRVPARLPALAGCLAASCLLALASAQWMTSRLVTRSRSEMPEQALSTLHRAVRLDRFHGEASFALGVAWLEAGQPDAALQELRRSKPLLANVGTEVTIGNVCRLAGDTLCAIEAYERALALHPGAFRAHANLADALSEAQRPEEASKHLRIARRLWPGNPHLDEIEQRILEKTASTDALAP